MTQYTKSPSGLNSSVTVRCTKSQQKQWKENAKKCGLSLNSYIRCACNYLAEKETNVGVARYFSLATTEILTEEEKKDEG